MTEQERRNLVESYYGKLVKIEFDRPVGTRHEKNGNAWVYPINYGYIPGVLGGDGEELDVYLLGVYEPMKLPCIVQVIGAVFRSDDEEDKLLAVLPGAPLPNEVDAAKEVDFQERFHTSHVELWDGKLRKD
ncbi:MAG: inorganic diphosphatase [Clostridia bacterium]|nr:inorganic diphosphatase [Clostridia bacterium]